jgi:hypothetical protein
MNIRLVYPRNQKRPTGRYRAESGGKLSRRLLLLASASVGQDVYLPSPKTNGAFPECEQGVVSASSDAQAGLERSAALTHNDAADLHLLTTILLDPTILRPAVPPVSGATLPFFMCHLTAPSTLPGGGGTDHEAPHSNDSIGGGFEPG